MAASRFAVARLEVGDNDVLSLPPHPVSLHRMSGWRTLRFTVSQRKGTAVFPAFNSSVLLINHTLRQRDVGMTTAISEGVKIFSEAHDAYAVFRHRNADSHARQYVSCWYSRQLAQPVAPSAGVPEPMATNV
jgi:hypothetical protein